MCITAIIAGVSLLASAVGTVSSIASANGQKASAQYQAALRQKQLNEEGRTAEIQAIDQENERSLAYRTARGSALAAIGASGLGEHISFFQGIDPTQQQTFLRDVRANRLNLVQQQAGIADGIEVAGYGSKIAGFNASMSKVGAVAQFAKSAADVASFYTKNK